MSTVNFGHVRIKTDACAIVTIYSTRRVLQNVIGREDGLETSVSLMRT